MKWTLAEIERLQNRVRNAGTIKAKELQALRNANGSAIYSDAEEQSRQRKIEANYQSVLHSARTAGDEAAAEIAAQRAVLAGRARVRASDFSQLDLPIAQGYLMLLADDIGGASLADATQTIETIVRQAGPSNRILLLSALRVARQRADRLGDEPLDPVGRAAFIAAADALAATAHPGLKSEQDDLTALETAVSRLGIDAAMASHLNQYRA